MRRLWLLACLPTIVAAALTPFSSSIVALRRVAPLARASVCCCNPENDEAPAEDTPSALDLSRELAKYDSAGLRVRTAGPVRRTANLVTNAFGEAGALARFLRAAVSVVPFYGAMMVALLLAFGLQSSAPRAAMVAGARVNNAILNGGQWHRLMSPVFLHGGAMHLLSNLFSLYRVGPLIEAAYGPARAALLYLLSGIGGNLAGLWFGSARGMSIGASGAVFGLMGATAAHVLRNKRALGGYGDALLRNVVQILALNLFIGTRRGSGVDNLAHVGGFVSGAVLGLLLSPDVGRNLRPRGRFDYDDPPAEPRGDGTLLPSWAVRALLAATAVAYAAGLREAVRIATVVQRVYGR